MGHILTTDNLRHCRVIVLDWCCMCKRNGEYISHFLLLFSIARELMGFYFHSIWCTVGYATRGIGSYGLLVVWAWKTED